MEQDLVKKLWLSSNAIQTKTGVHPSNNSIYGVIIGVTLTIFSLFLMI